VANWLEEIGKARPVELTPGLLAATVPGDFSVRLACGLAELAAQGNAEREPWSEMTQGEDRFVAFWGPGLAAHLLAPQQFQRAFAESLPEHELRQRLGSGRLWLGGHGLGGAFALLAGEWCATQGRPVAGIYTFGCPRVSDLRVQAPVFRVVNGIDVAATVPPPWRFRHTGRHVWIDPTSGQVILEPNLWQRLPAFAAQNRWLVHLVAQGMRHGYPRAVDELLTQVLADHSPNAYVDRLRAALR